MRVEAVLALFPRVVDPQSFHLTVLTPLMAEAAVHDVLLRLGPLSGFSAQNPTGRVGTFHLVILQSKHGTIDDSQYGQVTNLTPGSDNPYAPGATSSTCR
jgi:hypothetical protein